MPAVTPIDPQAMMPAGGPGPNQNTISLAVLIDYMIQRTYHELTVLSELLPRKTDMERKIEIVQFASRTRQLFVRLLALVKWANSASKVDKCALISSFLDQQAMLFVDTADMLAKMARETLVNARLPSFSLPCAIDVLTKGTYTRLPSCIKEKIIPPDPITVVEKKQTLERLNQIIEHRLVTGDLPSHLRKPKIDNGRVKFRVDHEFEVTLTLMGDGVNIPWRLLDIEILVEDPETGDGKALVHSLQVNYIHQLVQSRLMDNERPLHDLYTCLHSFCQSLQLEVLYSQTQRLAQHRLGDNIRIEEYLAGKSLLLSYWRDPARRECRPFNTTYKLKIHVDEHNSNKPLQISHIPQIQGSESTKVAEAIRSDHLSVEKLLMQTIQVHSLAKLRDLEREFRVLVPGPCEIRDVPTILYVPVLHPCMVTERLCVAVNTMRGTFMVSIAGKSNSLIDDIEDCINADKRDLRSLLSKLRLWLALQRCKKSIQHITATCTDHLPFVDIEGHPLELLSKNRLYVKMAKQTDYFVIVEPFEAKRRTVDFNYYLLHVNPTSLEEDASKPSTDGAPDAPEVQQIFLKPGTMVKLDTYAITHGPTARLYDVVEEEANPLIRKRKLLMGDPYELPSKRPRGSPYFLPELLHVLSHTEERIPFVLLGEELQNQGLAHQGVEVDGDGTGISLTMLDTLPSSDISSYAQESLKEDLLSVKFKIQYRGGRYCFVEALFANCPLGSSSHREQGEIHRVHFFHSLAGPDMMKKLVQAVIDDWKCLSHLYEATIAFAEIYKSNPVFQSSIEIRSYSYRRLTLGYGPNKCFSVSIQYQANDNQFHLFFGTCGPSHIANCHSLVSTHLAQTLNNDKSVAHLAQVLIESWSPVSSIGKLTTAPVLGIATKLTQPVTHFMVMPQSPTHFRIVFRNVYCIDIHCRGNKIVAIRDGAYSIFDTSKVVETLNPIPGLKAFLNMYVDDTILSSAARRRSTTEDDHPPSPIGMDPMDFMSQAASTTSPAARGGPNRGPQTDGLRFHGPMTPPSNPQTPASPRMTQQGPYQSSSPANFPLASPPSLQHVVTPSPSTVMAPSPSNPTLHVPSPSSFVPAPSPSSLGITMPSPASSFMNPQGARNWPGSPSLSGPSPGSGPSPQNLAGGVDMAAPAPPTVMNPPSRLLPQRSWAASIPTLLSHEALDKLFTQMPLPNPPGGGKPDSPLSAMQYCPLERFLCCVWMRRHTQRVVAAESDTLQSVQCSEPGVAVFKNESLQFKVSLNPATYQSIHLKVTPVPEFVTQWDSEEIQMLEKFFETKVSVPPYKCHTLTAIVRLLGIPMRVLKDCIQIMRLEMMPERNLKWSLQWCLTIPQGAPPLAHIGTTAVVYKSKFLFMVQLTRVGPPASNSEPHSVIVPILYDHNTNKTLATQLSPSQLDPVQNQSLIAINNSFKRFAEFNPQPNDCSLYPAVRELLSSLSIPI